MRAMTGVMRNPREHELIGQIAQHLGGRSSQSDFLPRLAQCRVGRPAITGLDAPARKSDLARVLAQVFGANGEQDAGLIGCVDEPDQHRSRTRITRHQSGERSAGT